MANMFTVYQGELRTLAKHLLSGTEILTDAPPDNQGKGEYFSPTDLVATALGSCMITVMGIAARNHAIDIDGTTAKIIKVMASDPRRIAEIHVELTLPHDKYTDKDKAILEKTARLCQVANSLHPELKQIISFKYGG